MQTQPRYIFLTILVAFLTMAIGIGLMLLAIRLEQQHQSTLLTILMGFLSVVVCVTKIALFFFLSPRQGWRAWKSPLISYSSFLLGKKLHAIFSVVLIASGFLYLGVFSFHEKYDVFSAHTGILLIGFFSACLTLSLYACGVVDFFLQKSHIGRTGYLTGTPAMVSAVLVQLVGAGLFGGWLFLAGLFLEHSV